MKFLDEYRDYDVVQRMALKIRRVTTRPWTIMEVCGGQTYTIVKSGLQELLPPLITLVHGPGCTVCVTLAEGVEDHLWQKHTGDSTIDPCNSPAPTLDEHAPRSRLQSKSARCQVPGRRCAHREVVFFAVGFETTAPANAMADPGIQESLGHLRLAGHAPLELIIVGVVPKSSNLGEEISAPVMYGSSIAVHAVARLLMERGVVCTRRHVTLPLNLWWLPDRGHDYAASSALHAHH